MRSIYMTSYLFLEGKNPATNIKMKIANEILTVASLEELDCAPKWLKSESNDFPIFPSFSSLNSTVEIL